MLLKKFEMKSSTCCDFNIEIKSNIGLDRIDCLGNILSKKKEIDAILELFFLYQTCWKRSISFYNTLTIKKIINLMMIFILLENYFKYIVLILQTTWFNKCIIPNGF